ncbi:MAG: hypothetical protein IPM81_03755 [Saprospirales bacterium]|nr:hypothetical protein [Saprospirales bacterium]
MKKVLTSILMLLLSLAAQQAFAVDAVKPAPDDPAWRAAWQNKFGKMPIDAAAFTAVTPRDIAAQTGKKLSFGEKIFLKIAQKRVKKQLAKGLRAQDAEGRAGGKNSMGIAAAALGALGLIFTLVSVDVLVLLGLIFGIMALIFGLIGIKRDENKILAIVGTALGAAVIFIWILAVIIVASWL